MNLKNLPQQYETVFGLGYWCDIALTLKRHQLRKFSGPFDWVLTPSLKDINRLLENNFKDYMHKDNLKFIGYSEVSVDDQDVHHYEHQTYILKDQLYNIISVHDISKNQYSDWMLGYPDFKLNLNRRINNFMEKIKYSRSSLFVRCEGNYNDVEQLQGLLSEIANYPFTILVVNAKEEIDSIRTLDWGLKNVVCIEIPIQKKEYFYDNVLIKRTNPNDWDCLLKGISID